MKLGKIEIEDFRGHESLVVPMTDLSVLVGRNNVGKSAVIQALLLLSRAVRFSPLSAPESGFNSFQAMSRNGGSGNIRLSVDLLPSRGDSPETKNVRYELELAPPAGPLGRLLIVNERLNVGGKDAFLRVGDALSGPLWKALSDLPGIDKLVPNASALALTSKLKGGQLYFRDASVSKARHTLRSISSYRLIPYRVSQPGAHPEDADDATGETLAPVANRDLAITPNVDANGTRTVELLAFLQANQPERLKDVVRSMALAIDGLTGFDFRASADDADTVDLIALFDGNRGEVPASQISDGTRNLLGLLTILASPRWSPVVCFEEPEIGLTAQACGVFAAALCKSLQDPMRRQQILVTTHSPFLLDELDRYTRYSDGPKIDLSTLVLSQERDGSGSRIIEARAAVDADSELGPSIRTLDANDWADLLRRL